VDPDDPFSLPFAYAVGEGGQVRIGSSAHPQGSTTISLAYDGVRVIERVDLGPDGALHLYAGTSSTGQGYLQYTTHTHYVFSAPATLFSAPSPVAGVAFSEEMGRLYMMLPDASAVLWAPFDPQDPGASLSWTVAAMDLSGFPDLLKSDFCRGSYDEESGQGLVLKSWFPRNPIARIGDSGSGGFTVTYEVPPHVRGFRFTESLYEGEGEFEVRGPANAAFEVLRARTGVLLGSSSTDAAGRGSIELELSAGDIVGLRGAGSGPAVDHYRFAFAKWGHSEVSSGGLAIREFGGNAATTLRVNNPEFGVLFGGRGPLGGGSTVYPAVLLVGLETQILHNDPLFPDQSVLLGPGVTGLNAPVYRRESGEVLAHVPLPIPDEPSWAGGRLCFQWLVIDGEEFVFSNVAGVVIQPNRWDPLAEEEQGAGAAPGGGGGGPSMLEANSMPQLSGTPSATQLDHQSLGALTEEAVSALVLSQQGGIQVVPTKGAGSDSKGGN
jgi:hypothetical protein